MGRYYQENYYNKVKTYCHGNFLSNFDFHKQKEYIFIQLLIKIKTSLPNPRYVNCLKSVYFFFLLS